MFTGKVPRSRVKLIIEPREVRGLLRSLGFAWAPQAKLLVTFGDGQHRKKVVFALAFFASAHNINDDDLTYYQLK